MEALREIIFEDEMETEVNSCRDQQYQRSNMQRSAIIEQTSPGWLQNYKTEKNHTWYYPAGGMHLL